MSNSALIERLRTDPDGLTQGLENRVKSDPENLELRQLISEVYFLRGDAERAMEHLQKSVELDPDGLQGGFSKFFWLGQILGGDKGLDWYSRGITGIRRSQQELGKTEKGQIVAALLGMIEIWMTDLCMQPDAESQCEKLAAEAMLLEDENPECWSILGSIRISQSRNQDACVSLERAAELYTQQLESGVLDGSHVPAIVRLAQSLLEMRMTETALNLTAALSILDDQVPDIYYLNALAHQMAFEMTNDEKVRNRHILGAHEAVALLEETEVEEDMRAAARAIIEDLPEIPTDLSECFENELERSDVDN